MLGRLVTLALLPLLVHCSDEAGGVAGPDGGAGTSGSSGSGGAATGGSGAIGGSGATTGGSGGATTGGSGGAGTGGSGATGGTISSSCANVNCGGCGQCKLVGGVATCECPKDYQLVGGECKLAIDPCASANCAADEACVPEAHCQALGACVKKCDCSNCGNCDGDNSDGKWNDWQEYCGNPNQSPAAKACNTPCPPGQGCLPYATPICWPMEGCLSL